MRVHIRQRLTLNAIPQELSILVLIDGLLLGPGLASFRLGWLANVPQGSSCLSLSSTVIASACISSCLCGF